MLRQARSGGQKPLLGNAPFGPRRIGRMCRPNLTPSFGHAQLATGGVHRARRGGPHPLPRSEHPPPIEYAVTLEALIEGKWTTVALWDNADACNEHHEHRYTRSEGKQAPMKLMLPTTNEAMVAAIRSAATDWQAILKAWRRFVNSLTPGTEASVRKVLEGIEDPQLEARYPTRTHFIGADHPQYGAMATRALFQGDPVVLVYPDGREIVFTPEHAGGVLGILL